MNMHVSLVGKSNLLSWLVFQRVAVGRGELAHNSAQKSTGLGKECLTPSGRFLLHTLRVSSLGLMDCLEAFVYKNCFGWIEWCFLAINYIQMLHLDNLLPKQLFFSLHHPYGIFSTYQTYQYPSTTHPSSKIKVLCPQEPWEALGSMLCWSHPLSATAATQKKQLLGPWHPNARFALKLKQVFEKHNQLCNVCKIEINTI